MDDPGTEFELKFDAPTVQALGGAPAAAVAAALNPVQSIDPLFRIMQSKNKTPSDLGRLLGRETAAELLSGARALSVDDLRRLRSEWSVSPALLI